MSMFTKVEGVDVLVDSHDSVNAAWSTTSWEFVTWPADIDDPLLQRGVDVLVVDMVRRSRRGP